MRVAIDSVALQLEKQRSDCRRVLSFGEEGMTEKITGQPSVRDVFDDTVT